MIDFISPKSGEPLLQQNEVLVSKDGERYPIVHGIPRFQVNATYTRSFGLQWKIHVKTQLDSFTGTAISQERLERCLGAPILSLQGKNVLEAGCGAGRFTELLVRAGAHVHAVDASEAVDANKANIDHVPHYKVAQADLLHLPFPADSFDVVICLGVLQHLPSPEEGVRALWQVLRNGGTLVIDHYTWSWKRIFSSAPLVRRWMLRLEPQVAKRLSDRLVHFFFPYHWRFRNHPVISKVVNRISPCLTYITRYPELSREMQLEWALLDTFDHLTDSYKHFRNQRQILACLQSLGATKIWIQKGGNGIEARAVKAIQG